MIKDILIGVVGAVICLAILIVLGMNAQACEKNDCDRKMDKYTSCMIWHGRKDCRPIKRVMEIVCGVK